MAIYILIKITYVSLAILYNKERRILEDDYRERYL